MAYFFGDSFDLYTNITDCMSYWDATVGSTQTLNLSTVSRFVGGRSLVINSWSTTPYITKTSGVNDAVHHISVALYQPVTLGGGGTGMFFTFYDGATAQCTVCFRQDGALVLYSGGVGGTILATWPAALPAQSIWYQYEIEVIINNTTGSIAVRRNGNTTNDFAATALNTRGGTANNYANKIGVGTNWSSGNQNIDDFLWRSDASSVSWIGDIRCYVRRPISDAAITWTPSGAHSVSQTYAGGSTEAIYNTQARFAPYFVNYSGEIDFVRVATASGASGNIKCAIWASDLTGSPTTVLGVSGPQAVVVAGTNSFTFSPPIPVVAGQKIWVGAIIDTTAGNWSTLFSSGGAIANVAYAVFPQPNQIVTTGYYLLGSSISFSFSGNWGAVADQQQDALASYVYSSTPTQADFYTLTEIPIVPTAIIGVTTRGFMQKSDAGTRNAAVQLKSSSTTVQSTPTALNTTWQWFYRNDLVDPATGTTWSPSGVDAAQIGPIVTA